MTTKITRGTAANPSDAERIKLGLSWSNYTALLRRRDAKAAEKAAARAASPVVPGLDYCDAAGNYVGGKQIPGSAPDDLI